jgi:hypothetical protein
MERHCIRCGRAEPDITFSSDKILRCEACEDEAAAEKKDYYRVYHRARGMATRRLIQAHQDEFDRYLAESHRTAKAEEARRLDGLTAGKRNRSGGRKGASTR